MKRTDGRKLSHEALEGMRMQAVRAVVHLKRSPEKVIEAMGMHRANIYKWLKLYKEGGWDALKSTVAQGPEPKINAEERRKLKKWLKKDPRQLHFDFGLWTIAMVQELLQKKFGKTLAVSGTHRLLNDIGYTCQKPLQRAYEQNPEQVEKWKQEIYPEIQKEAKKEKRTIFFADESGFKSTDKKGTTWAQKGKRPIVRQTGKRYGVNSISAIATNGQFRFSLYEENMTGPLFIDFLKKLLDTVPGNITLIVDGHPVHKRKLVKEFIEGTNGRLKMYFLPPYSPELNPDEQVWQHTKPVVHKQFPKSKQDFIAKVRSHLHKIQKDLSLLQSFFCHPDVAYATGK